MLWLFLFAPHRGRLCLHHPSPSASPTPVSLRLGHGSALTVHRTVIHSLAAASLPRQVEVEVTLVWRRPHPSRQQSIIFDIVCTLPRHLLPPEKVYGCAKASLPKSESIFSTDIEQTKPLPPGEVSAEPTERDDANKYLLRWEKVDRRCTNKGYNFTLAARRMRSFSRQNGKVNLSSRLATRAALSSGKGF